MDHHSDEPSIHGEDQVHNIDMPELRDGGGVGAGRAVQSIKIN